MADTPETENTPTSPMSLDDRLLEEYRDDLHGVDISDEAAKVFLMSLFRIMSAFVDLGVKIGPTDVEDIIIKQEKHSDRRVDVLRLLHLEDMPHETVAPRSPDNEKEQP
ncbi:hypothetical protein [uncultured Roseobacter sp.]|uniref:hypothetical protein n=1 Tax=uncultured Roseobacter sp. TaxID=114847 RepID=UPI0026133AB5|nr:hypothetical protein [uncultured Roseobacter sp.]